MPRSKISAYVSDETRSRLAWYVEAHGTTAAVVERALLHHLQALDELPGDAIIPPRLLVTPASFQRIVEQLATSGEPIDATKALISEAPGEAGDRT